MRCVCALLPFALLTSAAAAEVRPITVDVTGGTLGVGPEVSYAFNPLLAVRGSATFLNLSGHGNTGGYRYAGHAKISNWGGTADVHPFANGFRLSAGARSVEHNRIRFTGISTRNRSFSGVTFTPEQAGTLSGTIRARSVAPIATLGYAHTGQSGVTFGIDGGVMLQGTPRPEGFSATGELATNPNAQDEYRNQQQRVRNAVDQYRYYPVLQLSLGYRF